MPGQLNTAEAALDARGSRCLSHLTTNLLGGVLVRRPWQPQPLLCSSPVDARASGQVPVAYAAYVTAGGPGAPRGRRALAYTVNGLVLTAFVVLPTLATVASQRRRCARAPARARACGG